MSVCRIDQDLGLSGCEAQDSPGPGGIEKMLLINNGDITGVTEDAYLYVTGFTLATGTQAYAVNFILDQAEVIVGDVIGEDGYSKSARANLRIHPRTPKNRRAIETLAKTRVQLLTKEGDGRYYLYGYNGGLKMVEGTESSGINPEASRSYAFSVENTRVAAQWGKREVLLPGATEADRLAATEAFYNSISTVQVGFIASGTNQTIAAGASGNSTLTLIRDLFTSGTVTFSIIAVEGGADITSAGATITLAGTSGTLPIAVGAGVTAGVYTVQVQATGGGYTDVFAIDITVT